MDTWSFSRVLSGLAGTVCTWLYGFPGWSGDSVWSLCPHSVQFSVAWGQVQGIFTGLSVSRDLLGDLIGDSSGATLPDISAKMAIISESETLVAMVFSSERTVDQP